MFVVLTCLTGRRFSTSNPISLTFRPKNYDVDGWPKLRLDRSHDLALVRCVESAGKNSCSFIEKSRVPIIVHCVVPKTSLCDVLLDFVRDNSNSLTHGLPSVEPARKIGDVAKPGPPQNAGCNRAAIAAFAMNDEEFVAIQLRRSIL